MSGGSRSRIVSALVQHAKETFDRGTEGKALVAPISPSPPALIQSVLNDVDVGAADVVLDLGCGDGRWLIAAALKTGCTCRGFDINETLLQKGRRDAAASGVSPLVILENRDIFEASLEGGTVIIVYLFREGLAKMKTKLEAETRPGVRVVSVGFHIRGWVSTSSVVVDGLHVYLYRVGEQAAAPGRCIDGVNNGIVHSTAAEHT